MNGVKRADLVLQLNLWAMRIPSMQTVRDTSLAFSLGRTERLWISYNINFVKGIGLSHKNLNKTALITISGWESMDLRY